MILPDIEFQLSRLDSRLGFLGDSFAFSGETAPRVVRRDAPKHCANGGSLLEHTLHDCGRTNAMRFIL